jgi:hypothetical protein
MARPRFIHNLRQETFSDAFVAGLSPHGYLLAPNNATAGLRALARAVRASRRRLLIDNGNFASIGQVSALFAADAERLAQEVTELENRLGRSLRARDLPPSLRTPFRDLSTRVRQHARPRTDRERSLLAAQLALDPTHLIGVEDITLACSLSLSLEQAYTGRARADYRRYNRAIARRAIRVMETLPNRLAGAYYPVASAISYNTARDAGQVFGEAGITRVAMGFGAYMADDNSIDYIVVGRREVRFPGRLPTRYTRTAAVATGFYDGYRAATGGAPDGFHFLGLGAPIMIAIVTLCAEATADLTFDATSPIKDATQGGTLYVTKPAYLKIRTRKAAFRLASDPEQTWACPCPFCHAFSEAHPFRYRIGHRWFRREGGREVRADDLRPAGGLFDAYPLLSEPSPGRLRDDVEAARIGHNHWAIEKVMAALRRASGSGRLLSHVERVVAAYVPETTPPFANAVQFGLRIARDAL